MPARDQQHQVGEGQAVSQARGQRVPGQMVDADHRQAGGGTQRLGRHQPGQDAADQPRPGRNGNGVQVHERQPGLVQSLRNAGVETFDMRTRRDFGDDPAKGRMQPGLALHHGRQDVAAAAARPHDRGRGIVAAAFDAKDSQAGGHGSGL